MTTRKYSLKAIKDIGKISLDGVLAYNIQNGTIEYCNKSLGKILGKSIDQIIDEGVNGLRQALKDDDDFIIAVVNQLKTKTRISNLELRLQSDEESYISVDAYYLARADTIVAIIKDITKTKAHVNYITEFGARKDTILDMVAHNLSGPLNLTNNLLDVIDQANKSQQYRRIDNPARLIRENTQHCIDIINSLLKEEHLASPNVSVESNRFDVIAKVNIIVERYKQFAEAKDLKILSANEELFVTGDDVKFFQILNNIISNAVKFTDSKGKIVIKVDDHNETFSVSVKDNGIGVPEYLHPHLFKKNTLAGRPGLRGEKSTGMGLYIVKKLVDLMNGSISFESEENKGSVFTVEFPKRY